MSQLSTMKDVGNKNGVNRDCGNEVGVSGTLLGNHNSAPKWIELLPAGDFAGRDGRGPFRLSNPEAVIAATGGLRMDAGLPIDYDHATDFAAPVGRPAPAAGWIRAIEVRNGALWGQVEWTRHGAAAVLTHEYRYISPVFEYSQDGEVQRLLRAALTNNPNLYLTAISAQADASESGQLRQFTRERADAEQEREHKGDIVMDDIAAELRKLFGLGDEATPEELLAEVRRLLNESGAEHSDEASAMQGRITQSMDSGSVADPARYVPIAQFEGVLTELNRLRTASARERAGFRVDAAMQAGKIVPAQREWAIAYCQANLRGFEDFVARQPAVVIGIAGGFEGAPAGHISFNDRQETTVGGGRAGTILTRTELTVCARLGLRPQDYLKRRSARGDLLTVNPE